MTGAGRYHMFCTSDYALESHIPWNTSSEPCSHPSQWGGSSRKKLCRVKLKWGNNPWIRRTILLVEAFIQSPSYPKYCSALSYIRNFHFSLLLDPPWITGYSLGNTICSAPASWGMGKGWPYQKPWWNMSGGVKPDPGQTSFALSKVLQLEILLKQVE